MEFQFIPAVQAQSFNATAQPTFGPLNINGNNTNNDVRVTMSTSSTTVVQGSTVTVAVEIRTGPNISIDQYQVVLSYDPQQLAVQDQDTGNSGIQSEMVDTLFTVNSPTSDNNYTSTTTGKVFLKASSSFPIPVNRKVVEIDFQAQKLGTSVITVDTTPIDGTRIQRGTTDIAYSQSSLTLDVRDSIVAIDCQQDSDCPTGNVCLPTKKCGPRSCQSDNDCPQGQACISGQCRTVDCTNDSQCGAGNFCVNNKCVGCRTNSDCPSGQICNSQLQCVNRDLPGTAIIDSPASALTFGLAILLVTAGLWLRMSRHARN